jgi:hypothetical protein
MRSHSLYASLRSKIQEFFLFGIIAFYPFVNLMDSYFKMKFLGEAFFNCSIFIVLLLMAVTRLVKYRYVRSEFFNHWLMFVITVVSMLIFLLNNKSSKVITFPSLVAANRFIFMPYLIFILLTALVNNVATLKMLVRAVVLSGFVIAVFRIANFYFFFNYQIASGVIMNNGEQTRNLLQGASILANWLVVCMFILTLAWKKRVIVLPVPLFFSLGAIMFLAILTTGSRYPQFIGFLIFLYGVKQLTSLHRVLLLSLIVCVCSIIYFFGLHYPHIIVRYFDSSGDRGEKLILSLSILFTSLKSFLIGTSGAIISIQRTTSGLPVSDNSYMLLAMNYGMPLALAWFFFMGSLCKKFIKSAWLLFYTFYILVGLALTNCILWDGWVFMVILGFISMAQMYGFSTKRGDV